MYIYLYTSPHLNVKIPKGRDFVYLQYLEEFILCGRHSVFANLMNYKTYWEPNPYCGLSRSTVDSLFSRTGA